MTPAALTMAGIIGFASGAAFKHIGRVALVFTGGLALIMIALGASGLIEIKWLAIEQLMPGQGFLENLTALATARMPNAAAFTAGFGLALKIKV